MTWPPQALHHLRKLLALLLKMPSWAAPFVTFTLSGFQSVKALTGPALHCRQEPQWQ